MLGERIVRRVPSAVIFPVPRVAVLTGHILLHAPICSSLRALDKCS
jgi:hypothetical protein